MKIYHVLEYRNNNCRVHSTYTTYELAKTTEWHLTRQYIKYVRSNVMDRFKRLDVITYHVIEKPLKTNLKGIIK